TKVIWAIVKADAQSCRLPSVAPHDLRRTFARRCHQAGGELDQNQFLLGRVSIQTTERYLGCSNAPAMRLRLHWPGARCSIVNGVGGRPQYSVFARKIIHQRQTQPSYYSEM